MEFGIELIYIYNIIYTVYIILLLLSLLLLLIKKKNIQQKNMDFPHRSPMAAQGADISEDCRRDLGKSVRQLRRKKIWGSRSDKSSGYTGWYWCTHKTYLIFKNKILILHICSYMLIFNIRCILMNYMIRCDFRTWKIWRLQWTLKQKFGEMMMSPSVTKTQMSICHVPGPLRLQRCHWSALWCASR